MFSAAGTIATAPRGKWLHYSLLQAICPGKRRSTGNRQKAESSRSYHRTTPEKHRYISLMFRNTYLL